MYVCMLYLLYVDTEIWGQGLWSQFMITGWWVFFFGYGWTLWREIFLAVCGVLCARVVGATSSEGFLQWAVLGSLPVAHMPGFPLLSGQLILRFLPRTGDTWAGYGSEFWREGVEFHAPWCVFVRHVTLLMDNVCCLRHRCKKRFLRFLFWSRFLTFLTFFILSTFFICKKRWQNRRVSKRKNSNKIIPFNNIIFFSRVN